MYNAAIGSFRTPSCHYLLHTQTGFGRRDDPAYKHECRDQFSILLFSYWQNVNKCASLRRRGSERFFVRHFVVVRSSAVCRNVTRNCFDFSARERTWTTGKSVGVAAVENHTEREVCVRVGVRVCAREHARPILRKNHSVLCASK